MKKPAKPEMKKKPMVKGYSSKQKTGKSKSYCGK